MSDASVLTGRVRLNNLSSCPRDIDEFKKWIEEGRVEVLQDSGATSYGILRKGELPGKNDDFPFYLILDNGGNPCHFARYEPDKDCGSNCSPGGMIPICCVRKGELKTFARVANDIEKDRIERGVTDGDGWRLADGKVLGPDLTKSKSITGSTTVFAVASTGGDPIDIPVSVTVDVPSQYFQGEAPDWDVYTVIAVSGCL